MDDCIPWRGEITAEGYGRKNIGGRKYTAHVLTWEAVHGPVPKGYELHHVCENKACVNVGHLECLTRLEHRRRHLREPKAYCKHGHPLDEVNVYLWRGKRFCRTCRVARTAAWRKRNKESG